jgi:predicted glycoside hydrolase/deacetylase ChbG (UPF0249 family)
MKSIVLCADDYGQTQAISQAIIQLFQQKRLSATSCLTTSPHFRSHAEWLKSPDIQAAIGLHINLTEGRPLSWALLNAEGETFPALSQLMIKAHLRVLDFNVILAEINAQLDEFKAVMGHLPDFIDGHQHVHQLPVIRDAVLKIYDQRLRQHPHCYVRCVDDPSIFFRIKENAYIKRCLIQLNGASAFKKQLLQRKIPHNTSFSGIYNFELKPYSESKSHSQSNSYSQLFPIFLKQIKDNGLIMCHPGLPAEYSDKDVIFYSRQDEYQYFMSQQFLEDCQMQNVVLKYRM